MDISPFLVSFKISSIATVITLFLGFFCAYKMNDYKGKFKSIFESILNLALVLPPTVLGLMLLMFFGSNGLGGKFLSIFDINIIFTWQAGVIVSVIVTMPLMYRSIMLSINNIDKTIIEETKVVGASSMSTIRHIILPLSKNGILNGVLLSFLRSMGEFGATLMLCGNIPNKTQTISLKIYFETLAGNYQLAFLLSVILIMFSIFFMFIINYFYDSNN